MKIVPKFTKVIKANLGCGSKVKCNYYRLVALSTSTLKCIKLVRNDDIQRTTVSQRIM